MSGAVNKAILVGNVGRDPEARTMQSGGKVVTFSLATSEVWHDKASGERKERTQWHRIVIYNEALADIAERYVRKGAKLYIMGAIETRKYTDQSGQERETTEIVLRQFRGELVMLGSKDDDGGQPRAGTGTAAGGGARAPRSAAPPGRGGGRHTDLDDDIPFAAPWQ
jgi:single-strand DNA-binding protein